ncbi:MAG TPA: RND transporter, partial [Oligoflexia bacterium]|nr:RND transporter [Oligoflexia bacterium]
MKQDPKTNGQETKQVLRRRVALGLVVAAGCAAFFWKCSRNSEGTAVDLMTAKVVRGDLLAAISASGTIEPEEVIDVGAQVAGQIRSFGKDASGKEIDYGSVVDEGMVLAEIDDSLYRADVAEAKARVLSARAAQVQSEAKLAQTERDWKRAQKLGPSAALSQTNYDAYQAAFEAAAANVDVTRAQVAQAEAVLVRAELNLGYCTIRSPVRGVIIDRRVNIGQTVVSSFNAPSLFLIAKDL